MMTLHDFTCDRARQRTEGGCGYQTGDSGHGQVTITAGKMHQHHAPSSNAPSHIKSEASKMTFGVKLLFYPFVYVNCSL